MTTTPKKKLNLKREAVLNLKSNVKAGALGYCYIVPTLLCVVTPPPPAATHTCHSPPPETRTCYY